MVFRDRLEESGHLDAAEQQVEGAQQRAETVSEAVGPWISLEKTDVQLWTDILTVVLLFLIWREVSRGGV